MSLQQRIMSETELIAHVRQKQEEYRQKNNISTPSNSQLYMQVLQKQEEFRQKTESNRREEILQELVSLYDALHSKVSNHFALRFFARVEQGLEFVTEQTCREFLEMYDPAMNVSQADARYNLSLQPEQVVKEYMLDLERYITIARRSSRNAAYKLGAKKKEILPGTIRNAKHRLDEVSTRVSRAELRQQYLGRR